MKPDVDFQYVFDDSGCGAGARFGDNLGGCGYIILDKNHRGKGLGITF